MFHNMQIYIGRFLYVAWNNKRVCWNIGDKKASFDMLFVVFDLGIDLEEGS